jgi:tRNA-specific 2-thiouridylase
VHLAEPEEAVAPGQACVFYKESRLIGGGWIAGAAREATGQAAA